MRTKTETPHLLTTAEAAIFLAVSRETVKRLIARGDIDSLKIGSARRIPRASLELYVDQLVKAARRSDGRR
jgi:excisionase family DNA binding protein